MTAVARFPGGQLTSIGTMDSRRISSHRLPLWAVRATKRWQGRCGGDSMGLGTSEQALTGPGSGVPTLRLCQSSGPGFCIWLRRLAMGRGCDGGRGRGMGDKGFLLTKGACACGWRHQAGGTALAVGSSDKRQDARTASDGTYPRYSSGWPDRGTTRGAACTDGAQVLGRHPCSALHTDCHSHQLPAFTTSCITLLLASSATP